MIHILLIILYLQFVNEFIFQLPRSQLCTYLVTGIIFIFCILLFMYKLKTKVTKTIVLYFSCLPLIFLNPSFLASVNIFGFALYLRNKKEVSIKYLSMSFLLINLSIIFMQIMRIWGDRSLIRVWGEKFGENVIVRGFNNPNTEAEFYYLFTLSIWFIIRNKFIRNAVVFVLAIIVFQLTLGRMFSFAILALCFTDLITSRRLLRLYKFMIISIPIIITFVLFVAGYLLRDSYIPAIDTGLAGRLFFIGQIMSNLNIYNFLFGFVGIITVITLDVSTFAIFATRGIIMLVFMFICYVKYIDKITHRYKYFPAIVSIVITSITSPTLSWFSISMVIFLCLLEHARKQYYEFN